MAAFFADPEMMDKARAIVREELEQLLPELQRYKAALAGKKAAIYVGGPSRPSRWSRPSV